MQNIEGNPNSTTLRLIGNSNSIPRHLNENAAINPTNSNSLNLNQSPNVIPNIQITKVPTISNSQPIEAKTRRRSITPVAFSFGEAVFPNNVEEGIVKILHRSTTPNPQKINPDLGASCS